MEFRCKVCAGSMTVDPLTKMAVCEYCGAKQMLGRQAEIESSNRKVLNEHDKKIHIKIVIAVAILALIIIGGFIVFLALKNFDERKNIEEREEQVADADNSNEESDNLTADADGGQGKMEVGATKRFINGEITADFLKQILAKKTSIYDLKSQGYELAFEDSIGLVIGKDCVYRFVNTDVSVVTYQDEVYDDDSKNEEKAIVHVVYAPMALIDPKVIGETDLPYIEGQYVYYPNGSYSPKYRELICDCILNEELREITKDTRVAFKLMNDDDKRAYERNISVIENSGLVYAYDYDSNYGFIFPDSDKRLLTDIDLSFISGDKWQLAVARNEIYARHGYQFTKNKEMAAYFANLPWYIPITTDQNAIYNSFSDTERRNVELIKQYEKRLR